MNLIENPKFRELLIFAGKGCTAGDIPHRTKLTGEIIEVWKRERMEFSDDMKVCLIVNCFTCFDFHALKPMLECSRKGFTDSGCLEQLKSYIISWCNRPLYCP